jgi:hypothetical protein
VPASTTLFLVSHADGTIVVYDKEREDGMFSPQEPTGGPASLDVNGTEDSTLQRNWDPADNIFVTMPPWHPVTTGGAINVAGKPDKDARVAKNPVSHWRIARKGVVGQCFPNVPAYSRFLNPSPRFRLFSGREICRCNIGGRLSTSHRCISRRVRQVNAAKFF